MRVDGQRESDNVEDIRGQRSSGKRGMGCAGIALTIVIVLGALCLEMCGVHTGLFDDEGAQGDESAQHDRVDRNAPQPYEHDKPNDDGSGARSNDETASFVKKVLATTEDHWERGYPGYTEPRMVLFTDDVDSGCGYADAAVGPFYCPVDKKVYLDVNFFQLLHKELGSPGDFAQAYVVAHEVGHHLQKLTGISDYVDGLAEKRHGNIEGKDGPQVRMELQADCYAGMWAAGVKGKGLLEAGDVDEAMRAASRIGDDYLQKRAGGGVMPDSFTHGTSAQRVKWFKTGMNAGGNMRACDTFRANPL